jgi:catechol 2,3-dioxygenase-like lactoylglutathione lyase family enzyme
MPEVTVARIVLAATNVAEMAAFYARVFEAPMEPCEAFGTTLYRASAPGIDFTLCPNSVAGVQADQSRHQVTYRCANLATVVAALAEDGYAATVEDQDAAGPRHVVLADPDGNTLELVRA